MPPHYEDDEDPPSKVEMEVDWDLGDDDDDEEDEVSFDGEGEVPRSLEKPLAKLKRAINKGGGSVVLVNGETGVGKSILMDHLVTWAEENDLHVLRSSGQGRFSKPLQPVTEALSREGQIGEIVKVNEVSMQQVFLIDRNTGLLIAHSATSQDSLAIDEDMVSSMFTAIQSFVSDSFKTAQGEGGGLGKLEYQDTVIVIEHGSFGYIAAVMHGEENPNVRVDLKTALETFENKNKENLSHWDGDLTGFQGVDKTLTDLISKKYTRIIERSESQLESERIRIFEEVRNILGHISVRQRTLFVIDDLHNADEATVRLLDYLSSDIEQLDVVMVATYTPEDMDPAVKKVVRSMVDVHGVEEVSVEPLDIDQTVKLIMDSLPKNYHEGEVRAFAEEVFLETRGIPGLIKEVVEGVIEYAEESGDEDLLLDPSTRSMEGLMKHYAVRVNKLQPRELIVAEWASIAGADFTLDELESCIVMSKSDVQEAIEQLVLHKFLDRGEADAFKFTNPRISSTISDGISHRWKKVMHTQIANYLEMTYGDSTSANIFSMADHFSKGMNPYKAVTYCHRAGDMSLQMLSVETAINYYYLALQSCGDLSHSEGREANKVVLNMKLSESHYLRGSDEDAMKHAQQVVEHWSSETEKPFLAKALRILAQVQMDRGDHAAALDYARKALETSKEISDSEIWEARVALGDIYAMLGQMKNAWKQLQMAEDYCKDKDIDEGLTAVYQSQALVYSRTGRYREAINHLEKALGEAYPRNDKRNLSRINTLLGWCYLMMYHYPISDDYLKEGIKYAKEIDYVSQLGHAYAYHAHCLSLMDEPEDAAEVIEKAIPIFKSFDDKRMMAYLDMVHGIILNNEGEEQPSREKFQKALSMFQTLKDSEMQAVAAEHFARMLEGRGYKDEAKAEYTKARDKYKDMSNRDKVKEMLVALKRVK